MVSSGGHMSVGVNTTRDQLRHMATAWFLCSTKVCFQRCTFLFSPGLVFVDRSLNALEGRPLLQAAFDFDNNRVGKGLCRAKLVFK
jgi:hypothetical protein